MDHHRIPQRGRASILYTIVLECASTPVADSCLPNAMPTIDEAKMLTKTMKMSRMLADMSSWRELGTDESLEVMFPEESVRGQ